MAYNGVAGRAGLELFNTSEPSDGNGTEADSTEPGGGGEESRSAKPVMRRQALWLQVDSESHTISGNCNNRPIDNARRESHQSCRTC